MTSAPAPAAAVISCRGVWKLYGSRPQEYLRGLGAGASARSFEEIRQDGYIAAVRDVSFDLAKGEMLVVMGLSGSGKSTLVRCLSRLVEITGGEIQVEGRELASLSEGELIALRRRKMGMVFQNFALLPHRTVLENVAFPLEMRGQELHSRRRRAQEMVELVGLAGREEYFPRELSGGQQQRVGIARSLAIEPDIWFLDEPFSALDPLIRREMQDEFLRLQEMLGKTIVFITHDFDEALRLADRIAIMKDGVIEQIDTPANIVLQPATPYVERFTAEIEKARVVRAGEIMQPLPAGGTQEQTQNPVAAGATIRELSAQLLADERPHLPVADAGGAVVGLLPRRRALEVLFGGAA